MIKLCVCSGWRAFAQIVSTSLTVIQLYKPSTSAYDSHPVHIYTQQSTFAPEWWYSSILLVHTLSCILNSTWNTMVWHIQKMLRQKLLTKYQWQQQHNVRARKKSGYSNKLHQWQQMRYANALLCAVWMWMCVYVRTWLKSNWPLYYYFIYIILLILFVSTI